MSRFVPLVAFALVIGYVAPALAETDAEKQARIQAAIEVCDEGAAVPLDPEATAPPVQLSDLLDSIGATFDTTPLVELAATCKEAMEGAPDQHRLKLQYIRVAIAVGDPPPSRFVSDVRAMAAAGSAEANNLLYGLYRLRSQDLDIDIDRQEAMAGLTAAADAGLQDAISDLMEVYRFGPDLRRDPRQAAHYAELLMNLPPQGVKFKGATEDRARAYGRATLGGILVTAEGFNDDERARGFAIVRELYEGGDRNDARPLYDGASLWPRHAAGCRQGPRACRGRSRSEGRPRCLDPRRHAGQRRRRAGRRQARPGAAHGAISARAAPSRMRSSPDLYLDNRFTGRRPRDAATPAGDGVRPRIR